MKNKSPLEKLMVSTLGEPFWLNIVRFSNERDKWFPCFQKEYAGSSHRNEAVKLRKEWLLHLQNTGSPNWKESELKTVKITLYH